MCLETEQVSSEQVSSQRGSSFLELLLFLPIAFFFLFVVTDIGLFLAERASVRDSLRAVLNEELRATGDEALAAALVARLAAERQATRIFSASSPQTFVSVAVLSLPIDSESGAYLGPPEVLATASLGESPLGEFVSMNDFLQAELADPGISRFALPSRRVHDLGSPGFKTSSTVVYAEIRTHSSGINPQFVRSTLGALLTVQEQQVRALRKER